VNSRLAHDLLFHSHQNELLQSYGNDGIDQEKILEYPLPKRTQLLEEPLPEIGAFVVLGFVDYTY
jgi:hypothetical protein